MFSLDIQVQSDGYETLIEFLKQVKGVEKDEGLIRKLTARGLEILKEEAGKVNFITTTNVNYVSSMESRIENYCTGVLYSTSDHAAYNEFGTGVVGLQADISAVDSALGLKYENGWHYFADGEWHYTRGQKGQFVFYKTILRLQEEMPMLIEEYIKDFFKQIGG